ncbi:amidohydrolase family protein [Sphingomicrobium sediminis]|uniref:Amidohydrolase family protein n=1 Tax=Sphingomicrobium sediminis TaxID=2950949 RepID=A0A9X2EH28_9SPHN|nr:amidohydrolase family protein [Sphingomicrobium sediminis]MCM8557880.1 amidohydrolase family protein [Sphingomicrobium sediminis]
MKSYHAFAVSLAALAASACSTTDMAAPQPAIAAIEADLLIANVTVIDPETGTVLAGRDVLVKDGRILSVATHGSTPVAASQVIDAAGHYLMPGLFDMHSHTSFNGVHESSLLLMHANGVTGVREMGSDCGDGPGGMGMCIDEMLEARAAIEAGDLVGPRLVMLSSAKIEQGREEPASDHARMYEPTNIDEAVAAVAAVKARDVEYLKVSQGWEPDVFVAFMQAADAAGMRVGGHIPMAFSVAEISELGLDSIEHARDLPMDCATVGVEFRDQIKRKLAGEDIPWPDRQAIPGRSLAEYDDALCQAQIQAMVDNDTYYVPTHLTREMDYRAGEDAYRDDPRFQYIPVFQRNFWGRDLDRTAQAPAEFVDQLEAFYYQGLKLTGMAHDMGVKVMVGTDANDTMVFPGFSVHDELGNLVEAGLTPMEALQAATSVPAAYLGRSEDFGGVSAGKLADLVLLSANPTENIDHSDAIVAVVQGGRVSDRAALDGYLQDVRDHVARAEAQAAAASE